MAIDKRMFSILKYNNIDDVNIIEKFLGQNNNYYEVVINGDIVKLKIPGYSYLEADDLIDNNVDSINNNILIKVETYSFEEEIIEEEPVVEEPVVKETVVEETVVEETVVKEPVVKEPVVEEPVVKEPVVEETVVEEPVVKETVVKETVVEETFVKESVEEPVEEIKPKTNTKSKTSKKSKSNKILDDDVNDFISLA